MPNNKDSAPFDAGYKLLFSNPRIVQDLLEGFVRPEWIDEIDFQTLEPFTERAAHRPGQRPAAAHRGGLAKPSVESKI